MAPETTSAQDSLEKGALWWPGGGPREDIYWKMLKVSLCASDFSSQRQKRGLGGESFEGPSLPIVLMPFDGRGEKIQHVCLRIKSGPSNADSSWDCLYTPVGKTSSNTLAQLLT